MSKKTANIHYNAIGVDNALQRRISEYMHELTKEFGEFTLANLGYLHVNTLYYNLQTQQIELKIFFDARLAMKPVTNQISNNRQVVPKPEFNIFSGSLFVGDIEHTYSTEQIVAPKAEIVKDEFGHDTIRLSSKNKMKLTDAMVMHCSYPIAMAAIHNISLKNPGYIPRGHVIATASEDAVKSVIPNVKATFVPMEVNVEFDPEYKSGYSMSDIDWYLAMLNGTAAKAKENQKKLAEEVRKRGKKNKKKTSTVSKGFAKYS